MAKTFRKGMKTTLDIGTRKGLDVVIEKVKAKGGLIVSFEVVPGTRSYATIEKKDWK